MAEVDQVLEMGLVVFLGSVRIGKTMALPLSLLSVGATKQVLIGALTVSLSAVL